MSSWQPADSIVFSDVPVRSPKRPKATGKQVKRAPKQIKTTLEHGVVTASEAPVRPMPRPVTQQEARPQAAAASSSSQSMYPSPQDSSSSEEEEDTLRSRLPKQLTGTQKKCRSSSLRVTMGGDNMPLPSIQSDSDFDSSIEIVAQSSSQPVSYVVREQDDAPARRRVFGPLSPHRNDDQQQPPETREPLRRQGTLDAFFKSPSPSQSQSQQLPAPFVDSLRSVAKSHVLQPAWVTSQHSPSPVPAAAPEPLAKAKPAPQPKRRQLPDTFTQVSAPSSASANEASASTNTRPQKKPPSQAKAEKDASKARLETRLAKLPRFSWNNRDGRCGFRPPSKLLFTASERELASALDKVAVGPVGFDMEWNFTRRFGPKRTAIVQICDAKQVIIFSVSRAKSYCLPKCLVDFLSDERYLKLGVNISGDARKLHRDFDSLPPIRGLVELTALAREIDYDRWAHKGKMVSLQELAAQYVDVRLEKGDERTSNWEAQGAWAPSAKQMSQAQLAYAAGDVVSNTQLAMGDTLAYLVLEQVVALQIHNRIIDTASCMGLPVPSAKELAFDIEGST